jgi:hypothetical protein
MFSPAVTKDDNVMKISGEGGKVKEALGLASLWRGADSPTVILLATKKA